MKATRRDLDKIAALFKAARKLAYNGYNPEGILGVMVEDMADILEANNQTFQRDKFIEACGGEQNAPL